MVKDSNKKNQILATSKQYKFLLDPDGQLFYKSMFKLINAYFNNFLGHIF